MIGNKKANKIQKVSKNLQQNNSETVGNEYGKEIPKERYDLQMRDRKMLMN